MLRFYQAQPLLHRKRRKMFPSRRGFDATCCWRAVQRSCDAFSLLAWLDRRPRPPLPSRSLSTTCPRFPREPGHIRFTLYFPSPFCIPARVSRRAAPPQKTRAQRISQLAWRRKGAEPNHPLDAAAVSKHFAAITSRQVAVWLHVLARRDPGEVVHSQAVIVVGTALVDYCSIWKTATATAPSRMSR